MADNIPNQQGSEPMPTPGAMPGMAPPSAGAMPLGTAGQQNPAAVTPSPATAQQTNANLPVQLTLQVGSVSMELGKLLEMNAGMVLTDEVMTFFPKVRVLAGDRAVAEGELVQIEGKVGLRVSKLLG